MKHERFVINWPKFGLIKKITLVGVVSITITLLTSLIVGIIYINEVSRTTMITEAKQSNQLVAEKISQILTNVEHMTELVIFSDTVQRQFNLDNRIDQIKAKYTLSSLINNLIKHNKNTDSAILYHRTGWIITSGNTNLSQIDERKLHSVMNDTSKYEKGVWSDMHNRMYTVFSRQRNAVSLYRSITSIYSNEQIGIVVVDVPEEQINLSYIDEIKDGTRFFITDMEGQIISASNSELIYHSWLSIGTHKDERTFIDDTGRNFIVTTTPIEKMGWNLIRLDEKRLVQMASMPSILVIIGISLLVEFLTVIAVTLIIRHLMKPINSMIDIMNNPQDSIYLNQQAIPAGDDEIDRLVNSFRTMQQRIRILIERIRFEEDQKAKQEIIALQANIKPHFLYNTLDSICALIQMERNEDAIMMLKSIENFYRGTLSRGRNVITLREELNITHQYLQIQKIKYAGTLNYIIDVSDDVMEIAIPKLTLQPLVENAIYHGLKNGRTNGIIRISETHNATSIKISVEDNGIGFHVTDINNWNPRKQNNESYAISNVVARLKLCFGVQSGLTISSEPGHGTNVSVSIPIMIVGEEKK